MRKSVKQKTRTKQIRFQTPCLHAIQRLWKERKARYYADIRILLQNSRSSMQTISFSYTTNLGIEETFLVKRFGPRCIPRLAQKTLNGEK